MRINLVLNVECTGCAARLMDWPAGMALINEERGDGLCPVCAVEPTGVLEETLMDWRHAGARLKMYAGDRDVIIGSPSRVGPGDEQ